MSGSKLHPPIPCGSLAARQRHRYRGEPIDEECRAAWGAYQAQARRYTRMRRKPPSEPKPTSKPRPSGRTACGSMAGALAHACAGQPLCVACQAEVAKRFPEAASC